MTLRSLALLLCCVPLVGQERDPFMNRPTVRASGDSVVQAKPDLARVDFGVTSQGTTAQAAAAQNAKQLDAVLAALRRALGAKADIKTVGYSLNPDYRYPREGGKPEITGYTANNTVQVTTMELDTIGKLIDAATQAGANTVHRLHFSLRDEQAVRAQALAEATKKARANADAIAAALGVKVVRILLAQAGGGPVIPVQREMMRAMAMADASAAPTPIESGTLEVRASVNLVLEVAQ
jgi:uncharacterized protein YggE